MEQGLGKTVTSLSAVRKLKATRKVKKVLVISYLRIARKVWRDEVKKWTHLTGLSVSPIVGNPKQRRQAIKVKADIYTINFENLRWLTDFFRKKGDARMRRNWPWDLVIIDEASAFRSGGRQGSERWKAFNRVCKSADRIWELTGTPGDLQALWGQIYFLDDGEALGKTLTAYRNRWFYKPVYKFDYLPFPGAEEEILRRIDKLVLSMKTDDYLDLPPIKYNEIKVEMSPAEMRQYKQFCKNKWVELCGERLTAVNAGALFQKCVQFANGAVYHNDKREWVEFFNGKIEALKEYMQISLDTKKPMLIIYGFQHDLIRIQQLAKSLRVKNFRVLKTEQDEDDWNAGKLDFLMLHPKGGGHGLNLQGGGEQVFFFSLTPSLEFYKQVRDRIAGGQRRVGKNVSVHSLITKGTADEDLPHILQSKDGMHDRMFEAMKKRFDFIH
jgi:SNF2 family DNA or RNA helicase